VRGGEQGGVEIGGAGVPPFIAGDGGRGGGSGRPWRRRYRGGMARAMTQAGWRRPCEHGELDGEENHAVTRAGGRRVCHGYRRRSSMVASATVAARANGLVWEVGGDVVELVARGEVESSADLARRACALARPVMPACVLWRGMACLGVSGRRVSWGVSASSWLGSVSSMISSERCISRTWFGTVVLRRKGGSK
jgi:hypothetical protein